MLSPSGLEQNLINYSAMLPALVALECSLLINLAGSPRIAAI